MNRWLAEYFLLSNPNAEEFSSTLKYITYATYNVRNIINLFKGVISIL